MVNQLPQGWKEVPFNSIFDVCNLGKEKIKQSEYLPKADGLLPVVDQGQNLVSGYSDQFQKVVLAKDNPLIVFGDHTRCVKYIDFDFVVGADGTQLIRTKENTLVKLGYYQLMSANIPNNGYSRHFKYVKEQTYKLIADKDEQDYIVKTLDAVAEMIELRKETIDLTKKLIPAIFQEMFGDPITNPKGWDKKDLGDVCSKVTDGSHNPPKGINGGTFILLSSQNILNNSININSCRFVSEDDFIKENNRTKLSYGDILLTIVGTIGRSAIYKNQYENIIFQRSVAVLSPDNTFVNSEYLNAYIQTDFIQNVLQNKAHGVAQLGIYLKDLRKVEVLCPPLSLQDEFAKKVEQINQNLEVQQKDLDRLQELFDQLLQKAFTGELTRGEAYGII